MRTVTPGNSDPLDEQRFLADTIDQIEQSSYWPNTAIVIAYDDSDGWYDHQIGPIVRPVPGHDRLPQRAREVRHAATDADAQNDRCGVGPRMPLMVISPGRARTSSTTRSPSRRRSRSSSSTTGASGDRRGSADTTAGTLDNMFDFDTDAPRSPAVIMNDTTGEVRSIIPSSESPVPGQGPADPPGRRGRRVRRNRRSTTAAQGPAAPKGPAGNRQDQAPGKTPKMDCKVAVKGKT